MQQTLFLMLGYPGAGKTTVAKALAPATGAVHIWADKERAERFTSPTHSHAETRELYNALDKNVAELLRAGHSVLYDANFNQYHSRQRMRHLASRHNARTVVVWVQTPKEVAYQRSTQLDTQRIFQMPPTEFTRVSGNLQQPHNNELYMVIDGTQPVTPALLQEKLANLKAD